jgi:antitoxin (DNA-binding transcriptional repressor) of toxin-antitoxin stability system
MTTITVDDIQSDFLGYLQMVQAGETLLITQADSSCQTLLTTRCRTNFSVCLRANETAPRHAYLFMAAQW